MKLSELKKIPQTLYFKIITGIIISILALGTISSIIIINTTDRNISDQESSFSRIITRSIGKTIISQILFSDPSLLQGTLNSLLDDDKILFAYILDENNNITYHTFHPFIPSIIENIKDYTKDVELVVNGYGNITLRSGPIYYGLIGRIVLGVKTPNNYILWIKIILINSIMIILIIFITIFILSKNLTTPLFSLIESIEDQDKHGIPKKILEKQKVKEFEILSSTINSMIKNIKKSHNQLKVIFDYSLRTLIILTDEDDNIILFNKGAENILGCNSDQLLNKKYYNVLKQGNKRINKTQLINEFKEEEWIFKPNNNEEVNINLIYTSIIDKNNRITGIIFFGQNITQRKQQELKILEINNELRIHKENLEEIVSSRTYELKESLNKLEKAKDKLVESEKLSSLGGLVAGVAHEINTPVGIGVTGASFLVSETQRIHDELLELRMTKKSLESYLEKTIKTGDIILQNMKKASDLVKSFKQVAVDRTTEIKRRFLVKEYIDEVLLSIQYETKKSKHKFNIICKEDFYIISFPGILSQILTNLIFNSYIHGFEYIDEGLIEISITNNDEYFIIEYKDNGCGIKPDQLSKIYEPFYTTKRGHGGTGLGLNIVYNLVSSNLNGTIDCYSEVNKYTKFVLKIPLY